MSSSVDSTPRPNRVKRKPAPVVDFRDKYPELDPADPFAPLSVLRSRSSGAALQLGGSQDNLSSQSSSQQLPVFGIYPSASSAADFYGARPKSSSSAKPTRESHYRTRSQSVAAFHPPASSPYGFWHQQSFVLEPDILSGTPQPPSLVLDDSSGSGTDSELDFHSSQSRGRHFFTAPRKLSSQKFERPRTSDCVPPKLNKVSSMTPMHQTPAPSKRQRKVTSTLLSSRHRPRTADSSTSSEAEYFGQPETTSSRQQRRTSFSPLSASSPRSDWVPSSYVHVSSPSDSSSITTYDPPSSSTSGYSIPLSVNTAVCNSARTSPLSHPHTTSSANNVASQEVEWKLPSYTQIARAGALSVVAHNGLRIPFSSLFDTQRTIVIFIRHFWCPMCQDYMAQLTRLVDPTLLAISGLRLAIIGNGSPGMITKYKQMFNTPFDVYTDPSMKIHQALGMSAIGKGEKKIRKKGDPAEYVKHGPMGGLAAVVFRALRVGLPLWEKGGDTNQLGGEFVLGPRNTCTYAHRMQSTRGHAPILDLLKSIGVCVPPPDPYLGLDISPTSCLSSPKEISFARASLDIRSSHGPIVKPSMPTLPKNTNRRSFACSRSAEPQPETGDVPDVAGNPTDKVKEDLPVLDIRGPIIDIRREDSTSTMDSGATSSPATSDATTIFESLSDSPEASKEIIHRDQPTQDGDMLEHLLETGKQNDGMNVRVAHTRPLEVQRTDTLKAEGVDAMPAEGSYVPVGVPACNLIAPDTFKEADPQPSTTPCASPNTPLEVRKFLEAPTVQLGRAL